MKCAEAGKGEVTYIEKNEEIEKKVFNIVKLVTLGYL